MQEWIDLAPDQGRMRAALYRYSAVQEERTRDDGHALLQVKLPRADWERLLATEHLTTEKVAVKAPLQWSGAS